MDDGETEIREIRKDSPLVEFEYNDLKYNTKFLD